MKACKVVECTNTDCVFNKGKQCTRDTIRLLFFLSPNERAICDGEVLRDLWVAEK